MFFWYLGAGTALLLLTLGPRRIDFRLALAGLVLPLADVPLRLVFFPGSRLGVHLYLHTFVFAVVLALAIMVILRSATARRWFVVPMAVVIHLLLAGMLGDPVGAFWPLLGAHFSKIGPVCPGCASRSLLSLVVPTHPLDLLREGVGLATLVYVAFAFGLDQPQARRDFLASGTLSTRGRDKPNGGPATLQWPGSRPGDRGPVTNGVEEGPGSKGQDAG
ncbi:MAG: hypothetical protein NVSMB32_14120 [Actinomycetota bacterium]